jgi:TonB family protein
VLDQKQIFVSTDPVPRRSVLLLTVAAYAGLLVWITVRGPAPKVRKLPETYAVQRISPAAQLAFNSSKAKPAPSRSKLWIARQKPQHPALPKTETSSEGDAIGVLREHAKQATAAIVTSIKQRQIYGFSPTNYQIPMRIAGEVPPILASEVPARFEQYVTVEVTIDVDGHVADARIVAGKVAPTIQQTLLSAIREFKYSPATRDGTPIPSQVDIVVHIPT